MLKRRLSFILLISILCGVSLAQEKKGWLTAKSTHFIVYYRHDPEKFINTVIDRSEGLYDDITDSLGFRRYKFWLWDKRAQIYIYDDADEYRLATGQPEWSAGCVLAEAKKIQSFFSSAVFFDTILPHEIGHIIFRELVGFRNPAVPVWLDEAVASYQEKVKYAAADARVAQAIKEGTFWGVDELSRLDPQKISAEDQVALFYYEAASLLNYLLAEFGKDNFVYFCQALRDKKDFIRALADAYHFNGTKELEREWQRHILR